MKHVPLIVKTLVWIMLLAVANPAKSQIIFNETFGQTTTRVTTPFMPTGSYTWADPNGSTVAEKCVLDNYYTVIAPANIRDAWPVPAWWWWSGPEPIGNTFGGAGVPATSDHTGNTDGAVMVVNAGTTLNTFYNRVATLTPGNSYRISFWMFLVSASSQVEMKIRDVGTNAVLGSVSTGVLTNLYSWNQYYYDFRLPFGCPSSHIRITLENGISLINGNDYYIDDIVLETIPTGSEPIIICPTSPLLPVRLLDFGFDEVSTKNISLFWRTDMESNIRSYVVERSFDTKKFTPIGTISARNSSIATSYVFKDPSQSPLYSTVYYRLKTVEIDQKYSYSKIIVANPGNSKSGISVYPQPTTNGIVQVDWQDKGLYSIRLFKADMQMTNSWDNYTGNSLTLRNLKPGVYILAISSKSGQTKSVKIVVN